MSKNNTTYTGISFPSLLGLSFVILKLCHVIDWSWWFVTAPFWLMAVIAAVISVIVIIANAIKSVKRH